MTAVDAFTSSFDKLSDETLNLFPLMVYVPLRMASLAASASCKNLSKDFKKAVFRWAGTSEGKEAIHEGDAR